MPNIMLDGSSLCLIATGRHERETISLHFLWMIIKLQQVNDCLIGNTGSWSRMSRAAGSDCFPDKLPEKTVSGIKSNAKKTVANCHSACVPIPLR